MHNSSKFNAEIKFENFCRERGWRHYKILTLPDIKTPDYFVMVNNTPFIVEVKELVESGSERIDIKPIIINGKQVGQHFDYNKEVDSVARKIKESNDQFKSTQSFNLPNLLIIYSSRSFSYLDKNLVFYAMYGKAFQRLRIRKLGEKSEKDSKPLTPLIVDRTLRLNKNNLVSAVGFLHKEKSLFVVHNIWAVTPLSFHIFKKGIDKSFLPKEIEFEEI